MVEPVAFLDQLFVEHFCNAPETLKEKFYAAVSPTLAGDALVHLARVHFMRHKFNLDEEGLWAVVLPVFDGSTIIDFGAFSAADPKLRRPYSIAGSIGFDGALWDANYHPERRLLLHYDVWSYLRAECVGCLPISWRKTALDLLASDVREVMHTDEMQAAKASALLAAALRPPRPYILKPRSLAA